MPQSASFSSFGMPFHWGTGELLNVYFTQAGIRRKEEDSQSVVVITVNCYVWIFKKNPKTSTQPHYSTLCSIIGIRSWFYIN